MAKKLVPVDLEKLREIYDLTQSDLATMLNTTRQRIARYERKGQCEIEFYMAVQYLKGRLEVIQNG